MPRRVPGLTHRVPGVDVVEIDANHYGIAAAPEAAEAAARFLAPGTREGSETHPL